MAINKIDIGFPFGGVNRANDYRQRPPVYSSLYAENVMPIDADEERVRGGSRPGLAKLTSTDFGTKISTVRQISYVKDDGTRVYALAVIADGSLFIVTGSTVTTVEDYWVTEAGEYIVTETGEYISFSGSTITAANPIGETGAYEMAQLGGNLYLADTTVKVYNTITGTMSTLVASAGAVPTNQPILCIYRGRLVLGGESHIFYMSRQEDFTDWDLSGGGYNEDPGRPLAGQLGTTEFVGDKITALIPYEDKQLIIACENSLWMVSGDPVAEGGIRLLSNTLGIINSRAWAITQDGKMYFLSNEGVCVLQIGGEPQMLSRHKIPKLLIDTDTSEYVISMGYDIESNGVYLFLTPLTTGTRSAYFIEPKSDTIWFVEMSAAHHPWAVTRYAPEQKNQMVIASGDGIIRKLSTAATTDDGTAITSHLLLGPIHNTTDDSMTGVLNELFNAVDGTVTYNIFAGDYPEDVSATALTAIAAYKAGDSPVGILSTGTWTTTDRREVRPRVRGGYFCIWLSSTVKWAYGSILSISLLLKRRR